MIRKLIVILTLSCTTAFAADAPASEASIKEMLEVTGAKKLLDGMWPQIDAVMKTTMQQAMKGHPISAKDQETMDQMSAKIMASMKDELSWDKMEPLYIEVYEKSFTQSEIDGMLAFYKSPAGVAVIKKLPMVVQQTMVAMQQRMGPMMQRMQKTIAETAQQIEAKGGKEG